MLKRFREWIAVTLAANFTTTSNAAQNTALTFQAAANEVWVIDVQMTVQCSSTGGVKIAIGTPAGATVEGWYDSSLGALTTLSFQRITAINTLTATATHIVATTPGGDKIRIVVTMGATPGAITIQAASGTNGQTTTIFAGSSLTASRAS